VKALLDAQLSHRIAALLAERGCDAHAITSRGDIPDNLPDAQVLALAHAERRAVVTNNIKDFRPLAAQRIASGEHHSGLILVPSSIPRTKATISPLADAIEGIMRSHPDGLTDSERWAQLD
jgi:hypothetical protein